MKRMYTDTVSPHAMGMRFAIDYYGIDHVMYGTESQAERQKLFHDNARRILKLRDPHRAGAAPARPRWRDRLAGGWAACFAGQ
jgi:aminocarboxymuconate-semialdehyde decarboxylase